METPPQELDLVVLGAGSGGLAASKRAAAHGARVAVVESSRIGGTCVIRGCIPKKLMVYASHYGAARHLAEDFGWEAAPAEVDWHRLCQVRDQVVNNLELAHTRYLAEAKVEVIKGRGTLVDAHTVDVEGRRLRGRHVLVATGAAPVMPQFPGRECCITSDDFFKLAERPQKALLVGGGYIAIELACVLQGLGCATTLVVRSRLLRGFDDDLRAGMADALRQQGIDLRQETDVERVEPHPSGVVVHLSQRGEASRVESDACVLFAAGRAPNTAGLGLREAGVALGDNGQVIVDAHHTTTTVPTVHALGDVIDRVNLTPVAIKAGRIWADRIFANKTDVTLSYETIATAVFGHPPIGAVGLTEAEATERFGDAVRIFKTRFIPLFYSATPMARKGSSMMKLVVHGPTDRVLGCHMLGEDAPEIIQGFAAAMTAGVTKAQLDATLAVHPTQAEEFVLMR